MKLQEDEKNKKKQESKCPKYSRNAEKQMAAAAKQVKDAATNNGKSQKAAAAKQPNDAAAKAAPAKQAKATTAKDATAKDAAAEQAKKAQARIDERKKRPVIEADAPLILES